MLGPMLPDIPAFMWVLVALGAVVALVIAYGIFLLLWLIAKGFVRACSFTRFRYKIGKLTGAKKQITFGMFFEAWLHMIGWVNGSNKITVKGGHTYKGFGNYVIVGKFVSPGYVQDPMIDDDELEEDDK